MLADSRRTRPLLGRRGMPSSCLSGTDPASSATLRRARTASVVREDGRRRRRRGGGNSVSPSEPDPPLRRSLRARSSSSSCARRLASSQSRTTPRRRSLSFSQVSFSRFHPSSTVARQVCHRVSVLPTSSAIRDAMPTSSAPTLSVRRRTASMALECCDCHVCDRRSVSATSAERVCTCAASLAFSSSTAAWRRRSRILSSESSSSMTV